MSAVCDAVLSRGDRGDTKSSDQMLQSVDMTTGSVEASHLSPPGMMKQMRFVEEMSLCATRY